MNTFKELISEIDSLDEVQVLAHVSPDPDAIGSGAGLALGLKSLGKKASFYIPEPVSERMSGLAPGGIVTDKFLANGVIIVVDTANKARTNISDIKLLEQAKRVIVVDHHISNPGWGDVNYIDGEEPASASIILDILIALGAKLDSQVANLLLAGLMDDTGCFRYSNTDERAFEAGSKLLKAGAQPEVVSNEIYFSVPERVFKIRALALNSIETSSDKRIGYLVITQEMLKACGASSEDTDGLIDEVRRIQTIDVAVMIREREEGDWKASLRSKGPETDVNKIAGVFGGGGHAAASGCTLEGDAETVKNNLLSEVAKHLK